MANDPLMTKKEVAQLMRVEPRTVQRWVSLGRLKFRRIGSTLRFSRADVLQSLERYEYGDDQQAARDPSMG